MKFCDSARLRKERQSPALFKQQTSNKGITKMNVPLPKNSFTPHPKGQHSGTIFDVEVRLNDPTQYGPKHRVILKIESDTPILDDDGNPKLNDEGQPMKFVIWDWLTVARKEGSRYRQRREAVLDRPLTAEEVNADSHDPVAEFMGQRISYVVKHKPNGDQVYTNIETMWLEGDRNSAPEASADLISECKALEQMAIAADIIAPSQLDALRSKYGQTPNIEQFTMIAAAQYKEALTTQTQNIQQQQDDDDLPF